MKIIVVDDSETMRMMMAKLLRQAGYTKLDLVEAASAKGTLAAIAKGDIDLVRSDVNMPEIDGIELVKVIREKFKSLPVVMITTESSPKMQQKMVDAGAHKVLTKPFSTKQLKDVLNQFFGK